MSKRLLAPGNFLLTFRKIVLICVYQRLPETSEIFLGLAGLKHLLARLNERFLYDY